MAFGHTARFTRAYQYGGWLRGDQPAALAEMRRRNDLWNTLVSLDREHEGRREAALELAEPRWPQICSGKDHQAERRAVYARDDVKRTLTVLDDERRAAAVQAKRDSGLYWCNADEVLAGYEAARRKPGELQFHGWYHQRGRLSVRWQQGLPVAVLLAGGDSRLGLADLVPARDSGTRRGALRGTAALRIDREGTVLRLPVMLHRALPLDGLVRSAAVSRDRIGNHARWTLTLVVEETAPGPVASGPTVAVDLGWRRVEGGLLVGTALGDADPYGDPVRCVLPEDWLEQWQVVEDVQSWRDRDRDALFAQFPAAAQEHRARWSPDRLARWVRGLRNGDGWSEAGIGDELRTALLAWYQRDQHHAERGAHLRDQLLSRRQHQYRNWAARLLAGAGALVLEDFDLRAFGTAKQDKERITAGERRTTAEQSEERWRRSRAAPSVLRLALTSAARHRGVPVHTLPAARTTRACTVPGCEHVCELTDYRATARVSCAECGHEEDQDARACRNLLRGASQTSPVLAPV